MEFLETNLEGLYLIKGTPYADDRGFFERLYCAEEFKKITSESFVQVNHSHNTAQHTFRGLHFQHPPFSETKLVSCINGRLIDVVVDIRRNSKTFLRTFTCELSQSNHQSILIPKGMAHGFFTLSDHTDVLYFHSEFYQPGVEGGLNIFDSKFEFDFKDRIKVISEKDRSFDFIDSNFTGI